ncbi:MAG: flagellar hook-basal body complex protein FliE [Sulfurospirillaceae bacterium]|nr:flagellar hook-basal body complex protein FliE [Sulfurospirillaceae bacterium]MDD3462885.1 flagellar hook-basal body complex protein FliE [Sulfurospirillaceae bacterium]
MQNNSIDKISALNTLSSGIVDTKEKVGTGDFSKILNDSINEVNNLQVKGDKALADIATGTVKDLHQAAIAIGKAETSMKMMLEIRNKALSAYKEIARTQI